MENVATFQWVEPAFLVGSYVAVAVEVLRQTEGGVLKNPGVVGGALEGGRRPAQEVGMVESTTMVVGVS